MAGRRVLAPLVKVRILAPQPFFYSDNLLKPAHKKFILF